MPKRFLTPHLLQLIVADQVGVSVSVRVKVATTGVAAVPCGSVR
jgi:hypothetical protein